MHIIFYQNWHSTVTVSQNLSHVVFLVYDILASYIITENERSYCIPLLAPVPNLAWFSNMNVSGKN